MDLYKNLLIFLVVMETTNAGTFSDEQQLFSDLENAMVSSIRPVINQDDSVNVTIVPYLINILSVDEKQQSLKTSIAFRVTWNCETLQWNSSEYGGINEVHVESNKIWLPDLLYINANGKNGPAFQFEYSKVTVFSNGHAAFLSGEKLESACAIDITKYPFDTQVCTIIIGKAYYLDSMMKIYVTSNKVDTTLYEENGEWQLVDTYIQTKKTDTVLTNIHFIFHLKRRTLYYCMNILLPIILLSAMNVLSFKLPATSGERMGYCLSLLLTFVVFLNMINDAMPKVSLRVSYLQLYINIQFILGVAISMLSMCLVRLSNGDDDVSHLTWIKRWFHLLHCNKRIDSIAPEISTNDDSKKEELMLNLQEGGKKNITANNNNCNPHFNKITAMAFIDNVCLWIFSGLFVITTMICLLIMVT